MTESTKIVGGLVNMRLKFSWSVIILQEILGWIYDNLLGFCTHCIDRTDFVNHRECINAHPFPWINLALVKKKPEG